MRVDLCRHDGIEGVLVGAANLYKCCAIAATIGTP
jgi:hypothetical protein